jgi:hypothetical protein
MHCRQIVGLARWLDPGDLEFHYDVADRFLLLQKGPGFIRSWLEPAEVVSV